jgi:hypothetical protein
VGAGEGRVTAVVPGQRADLMRQTVGWNWIRKRCMSSTRPAGERITV